MARKQVPPDRERPFLSSKRVQFFGALLLGVLVPWALRGTILPGKLIEASTLNAAVGNSAAVCIAFWVRLSVEIYPGIRRSYLILPTALASHGVVLTWFVFTRFPYDRVALTLGFLLHVSWLYFLFVRGDGRQRKRIAVVPIGDSERLLAIDSIDWVSLKRPRLSDARACDAIVADFSADLPDEWESFLANAALAGRIVYQHKQLSESLTGRVELEHLSENSFGSLVPARGYFYLKSVVDIVAAVTLLPIVLPLLAIIAVAILTDGGGPIFFKQIRLGHAAKTIKVLKFRTMRCVEETADRGAAITKDHDERITRVGQTLRKLRLDELPQIFNILKGEMSWIGPRPEAVALSSWYSSELPFYGYRHVVKPGISGWAQVNQGHVAEVEAVRRKLQYDFYYIKYFSPWLDILILVRTIKTIITGSGSK
jgi:lipopolysaccharide/colanic/teichoic acid biosynthesis glycosyltransferase